MATHKLYGEEEKGPSFPGSLREDSLTAHPLDQSVKRMFDYISSQFNPVNRWKYSIPTSMKNTSPFIESPE